MPTCLDHGESTPETRTRFSLQVITRDGKLIAESSDFLSSPVPFLGIKSICTFSQDLNALENPTDEICAGFHLFRPEMPLSQCIRADSNSAGNKRLVLVTGNEVLVHNDPALFESFFSDDAGHTETTKYINQHYVIVSPPGNDPHS